MPKKIDRYILLLPPIVAAALVVFVSAGTSGLPIDDAYIFARYASNIAHGAGYGFNPGEVSFGVTSFAWTVLNALFLKAIPGATFEAGSQILGVIALIIMIALVESWIFKETRSLFAATVAATLCALSPMVYMNAVSGMDTMLFVTAVVGVLYLYRFGGLKRPLLLGVAAGAVFPIRPEGLYVPAAIIAIELWFVLCRKDVSGLKGLALFTVGFLLISVPMPAYIRLHSPGWLPTTYYGKLTASAGCNEKGMFSTALVAFRYMVKGHWRIAAQYGWVGGLAWAIAVACAFETISKSILVRSSDESTGRLTLAAVSLAVYTVIISELWRFKGLAIIKTILIVGTLFLLVFLFISSLLRLRNARRMDSNDELRETSGYLALIGVAALPAVYGLAFRAGPLFGGYYNRYIAVLTPVLWILAAKGTWNIKNKKPRMAAITTCLALIYSVVFIGMGLGDNLRVYRQEAGLNESLRTRAAEWIRDNTPQDAVVMVGYTGLGAVGNRCERYVVDLGALINPDIIKFYNKAPCRPEDRWDWTVAYMKHRNVSYYVTMPYPKSDPHADPGGRPGFTLAAHFENPEIDGTFNEITIWRLERE